MSRLFQAFGHILHGKVSGKIFSQVKKRVFRSPFKNGLGTKLGDRKCCLARQA